MKIPRVLCRSSRLFLGIKFYMSYYIFFHIWSNKNKIICVLQATYWIKTGNYKPLCETLKIISNKSAYCINDAVKRGFNVRGKRWHESMKCFLIHWIWQINLWSNCKKKHVIIYYFSPWAAARQGKKGKEKKKDLIAEPINLTFIRLNVK